MTRTLPLSIVLLAACAPPPGGDFTLRLEPLVPEGHDPFGEAPLTLLLTQGGGREEVPLGVSTEALWSEIDVGALEDATLGLLWAAEGASLDPLDVRAVRGWGLSAPVSLDAGELTVPVWVGELGRIGTLGRLPTMRATVGAAAVVLPEGDVLLFGGSDPTTLDRLDAAITRPSILRVSRLDATAAFVDDAELPQAEDFDQGPRTGATATLLPDGTVFVAGGRRQWVPLTPPVASAFVWEPEERTVLWSGVLPEDGSRSQHAAVLRGNEVWLLGGYAGAITRGFTIDIFDVGTRTFRAGPELDNVGPIGFGHAVLADGTLVICGGGVQTSAQGPGGQDEQVLQATPGCFALPLGGEPELLPAIPVALGRMAHALAPAGARRVLLTGGTSDTVGDGSGVPATATPTAEAWLLDLDARTWSRAPDLTTARAHHSATSLPDGSVLLVGGSTQSAGFPPQRAGTGIDCPERYDPAAGTLGVTATCELAGAGAWPVVVPAGAYGTFVLAGSDGDGGGGADWGFIATGPSPAAP